MGLSRGRKRHEKGLSRATVLARELSALAGERRAGAIESRLLDAAFAVTSAVGGEITRPSGEVVVRKGAAGPAHDVLRCDLVALESQVGRIRVWGEGFADDASDALAVLAAYGAHLLQSVDAARIALETEARSRRISQAAGDIAGAGGRAEGLEQLLTHARVLLHAPIAAVLVPGTDGTFQAAVEEGVVVASEGTDLWAHLPAEAAKCVADGRAWFGKAPSPAGAGACAVAPLAHGEARYGALGLTGFADLGEIDRNFVTEFADRASAAIWIGSLEEEVRELSTVDPVTRLYDGRYFRQRLDQEISRAARGDATLSILVMGLDGGFELRAQGRDADADDALLDLAVQVGHQRRAMDVACRLAGDELAMILPGAAGLDAVLVAERLRSASRAMITHTGLGALSVGIASYPESGESREEIIAAGRAALGFARSYGGDRAFLYDGEVAALLKTEQHDKVAGDDAFVATVYALAAAVDARDPSTCEHSQGVARVAAALARELGLASPHVEQIRTAGLLHDVGKIGVSDRVLRKTGPLSDDEWDEMRQHPQVANRILAGTRLEEIRPWILHHHERVDGAGYPDGLAGEAIPFESRILSVAEAYDAMVQGRPWSAPIPPQAAVQEIVECSGTKFDPTVVGALKALAARGEPGLLSHPDTQYEARGEESP